MYYTALHLFCQFRHVAFVHYLCEKFHIHLWLPTKDSLRLRWVAKEERHLVGSEVLGVNNHMLLLIKPCLLEHDVKEFSDAVCLLSSNHIVISLGLLKHEPHGFDIVTRESPIAHGIKVA